MAKYSEMSVPARFEKLWEMGKTFSNYDEDPTGARRLAYLAFSEVATPIVGPAEVLDEAWDQTRHFLILLELAAKKSPQRVLETISDVCQITKTNPTVNTLWLIDSRLDKLKKVDFQDVPVPPPLDDNDKSELAWFMGQISKFEFSSLAVSPFAVNHKTTKLVLSELDMLSNKIQCDPSAISLGSSLRLVVYPFTKRGERSLKGCYLREYETISIMSPSVSTLSHEWAHALSETSNRSLALRPLASAVNKVKKGLLAIPQDSSWKSEAVRCAELDIASNFYMDLDEAGFLSRNLVNEKGEKIAGTDEESSLVWDVACRAMRAQGEDRRKGIIESMLNKALPPGEVISIRDVNRFSKTLSKRNVFLEDIRRGDSLFLATSKALDRAEGRGRTYWSNPEEMYARSFAEYITGDPQDGSFLKGNEHEFVMKMISSLCQSITSVLQAGRDMSPARPKSKPKKRPW